jgi:hypothetical protein
MLSRRDLVGKLAVGAAGAAGLATAWAAFGKRADAAVTLSARNAPDVSGPNGISDREPAERVVGAREDGHVAPPVELAPPPWELLHPLTVGSVVAHGWRVAELSGPLDGACVLTLQNERGRMQRVHVCRNDGRPRGLVYTKRFDLVVMNGGQGDLSTEEGFAQAVAAVSHVLAANEGAWGENAIVTALLPHDERLRQFADDSEWALR